MYSLGIPERQFRRTTQVLGPEAADPIEYESVKQDYGFYLFVFPEVDEFGFREIVNLLKSNGVTTIGADSQLTEKNIMKLTNLIKEQGSPDENDLIDILKNALNRMESKDYRGGGFEACELSNHYLEEIREIIEDYEEEAVMDRPDLSDMPVMNEQESSDRDTSKDTTAGEFNVNLEVQNEMEEVNIKYGHATGPLDDVTISWGDESHNVDFEFEETVGDAQAYDEFDIDNYIAYSEDNKWRFIVPVKVTPRKFSGDGGTVIEDESAVEWDDMEITVDDSKVDNSINESYFRTQMQKRAGIIK